MTQDAPFQLVREHDSAILRIALDRPAQRNAMSCAMVADMRALLDAEATYTQTRVIVLHGLGRGFCAGSDLSELARMTSDERAAFESDCGILACTLNALPVPVIAAVHGFAIGGGLTLAAACDLVVSAPDAIWSLPEVAIGLFPAWGLGGVADRVGFARARRLAMGISRLTGTEAAEWNLVDEIADDPLAQALAIAARLADMPATQLAQVKVHYSRDTEWTSNDRAANARFLVATGSTEAQASFVRFSRD